MAKIIEGQLRADGKKFALVVARFNSFLSEQLLNGALDCLERHASAKEDILVVRVPGSFEIPAVVAKLMEKKQHDAIIALGVLIRGATPHFDYIAGTVSRGLSQLALRGTIPVTFGIITADSIEQAIERAGTKAGNKGWEAALAAIEMVNLYQSLDSPDA